WNPDGTYTFEPADDFSGTVDIVYETCDDNARVPACDTATLSVTVIDNTSEVNSVIANNDENVSYGNTVSGDVYANDVDPQGDTFTITGFEVDTDGDGIAEAQTPGTTVPVYGTDSEGNVVEAGTITVTDSGVYTFTPNDDFVGEVEISYTIADDGSPSASDSALITIDVLEDPSEGLANLAPFAGDDQSITEENTSVMGEWASNDNDPNGDMIVLNGTSTEIDLSNPTGTTSLGTYPTDMGGNIEFFSDGTYQYTPPTDYYGGDQVSYEICDVTSVEPQPLCSTATIYLTVLETNTTVAIGDENTTLSGLPVSGDVTTNDFDPEGDNQIFQGFIDENGDPIASGSTVSGVDSEGNEVANAGTITWNPDGTYTFEPADDFSGTVDIVYETCDDNARVPACDTATLSVTVIDNTSEVNSVIANNDENVSYGNTVSGDVYANDVDPQGDTFTITGFEVDTDGDGIAEAQTPGTTVPVYGTDSEGNVVEAGTITVTDSGVYTFTPNDDFVGEVEISYTIADDGSPSASDSALITIDVLEDPSEGLANLAPFAGDDQSITEENTSVMGEWASNDNDPNGDMIVLNGTSTEIDLSNPTGTTSLGTYPTDMGGNIEFFSDGTYLYTPPVDYFGPDQVSYEICDVTSVEPQPLCSSATIFVTVLEKQCLDFDLWVYLEGSLVEPQTGLYNNPPMRTALNDSYLLPGQYNENTTGTKYALPGQPFAAAPWNYNGIEGSYYDSEGLVANAKANYPATVVDWVLVSLRTTPDEGGETICQRAGLLHSDGHIELLNTSDCCYIDANVSYYIVIEHRNHLLIMSQDPVSVVNKTITYDFRDKQTYINDVFNSGVYIGQKEVLPGVFVMYAGNGDQTTTENEDTDITAEDGNKWINNGTASDVYNAADYNMDGEVNALDYELWKKNSPGFTSVPRK
ncbi:Ig-like domain-containing protein, partial [Aestuariibaculum sediminum]